MTGRVAARHMRFESLEDLLPIVAGEPVGG